MDVVFGSLGDHQSALTTQARRTCGLHAREGSGGADSWDIQLGSRRDWTGREWRQTEHERRSANHVLRRDGETGAAWRNAPLTQRSSTAHIYGAAEDVSEVEVLRGASDNFVQVLFFTPVSGKWWSVLRLQKAESFYSWVVLWVEWLILLCFVLISVCSAALCFGRQTAGDSYAEVLFLNLDKMTYKWRLIGLLQSGLHTLQSVVHNRQGREKYDITIRNWKAI